MNNVSEDEINRIEEEEVDDILLKMKKSIYGCNGVSVISAMIIFTSEILIDSFSHLPIKFREDNGSLKKINKKDELIDLFFSQIRISIEFIVENQELSNKKMSIH